MRTIKEIEVSLPSLSTDELHRLERVIHELYRARKEPIIYYSTDQVHSKNNEVAA